MAKKQKADTASRVDLQAPADAWTPANLMRALRSGDQNDRIKALEAAGIIDEDGNLTKLYQSWGNKVTRTACE